MRAIFEASELAFSRVRRLVSDSVGSPETLRNDRTFLIVVITSAVMGALYGVFVQPYWSEAVEFGQAWAGLVRYETSNPWYKTIVSAPSLQITVPALLLMAGADPWPLSLAASAVFAALSFSATAATGYVLSRHWGLALTIPLLLLTYGFTDLHGYPVAFPITYFQFGQTGQYVALLAFSFAALGWPVAAGLIGGSLAGIHAVWCGAFAVGAFSVIRRLQRQHLRRFTLSFITAVAASVAFQIVGNLILPPRLVYTTPVDTASQPSLEGSPGVIPKARGTFQGHNILFSSTPSPLKAAVTFFLPELFFLGAVAVSFFTFERSKKGDQGCFGEVPLVAMVLIPIGLAGLFKLAEEIDPEFVALGMIDQRLPPLLLRAILTRWLNLSTLLLPILVLTLPVKATQRDRHWLAAISFAVLLPLLAFERQWYLLPDPVDATVVKLACLLPIAMIASFLGSRLIRKGSGGSSRVPSYLVTAAIALVLVTKIGGLTRQALTEKPFRGIDAAHPVAERARRDSGTLMVAPGVVGAHGFNPQIRTGRPILVPAPLDITDVTNQTIIHVFCYTDPSTPFAEFYANVQPCFENRSIMEWTVIREKLHATGLMTPDTWRLRIPVLASAGGFTYYEIPDSAAGMELVRSPVAVGINVQYRHRVSDKPDVCVPLGTSNTLLFKGIVTSVDPAYSVKWQSITVSGFPVGASCTRNPTVWDNTSGTAYSAAWNAHYLGSPGVSPTYFPELPRKFEKGDLIP